MISVNKNVVNMQGTGMELLAEMAVIAAMLKNMGIPENAIVNIVIEGMNQSKTLQFHAEKKRKKLYEDVMKEIEKRKNAQKNKSFTNTDEG